jgi:ribosomal protein S7
MILKKINKKKIGFFTGSKKVNKKRNDFFATLKKVKGKSTNLYDKFVGFLVKKGNKLKAKKILDYVFLEVYRKTNYSREEALVKLFGKLNSFVEVRKVRIRRKFILVPFPIRLKRRSYLVVKWIMQSVMNGNKKSSLSKKLTQEILNVLTKSKSKSRSLRKSNFSKALANKSNTHYRW